MTKLHVTFRSLSRSRRVFDAVFDLGSDEENNMACLTKAWAINAEIIASHRA